MQQPAGSEGAHWVATLASKRSLKEHEGLRRHPFAPSGTDLQEQCRTSAGARSARSFFALYVCGAAARRSLAKLLFGEGANQRAGFGVYALHIYSGTSESGKHLRRPRVTGADAAALLQWW